MPSCMGNAMAAQEEEMPEGWESQKTMEIHSQAGDVSVTLSLGIGFFKSDGKATHEFIIASLFELNCF